MNKKIEKIYKEIEKMFDEQPLLFDDEDGNSKLLNNAIGAWLTGTNSTDEKVKKLALNNLELIKEKVVKEDKSLDNMMKKEVGIF